MTPKTMTFSVKEICEIIEACAKGGVSVLKLGTLYLKLGSSGAPNAPAADPIPLTPEERFAQARAEEIALKENETILRADQLSQMRIEDPEQYEELVMAKELEHAGEEPEGPEA
jgi:hypothetical protein